LRIGKANFSKVTVTLFLAAIVFLVIANGFGILSSRSVFDYQMAFTLDSIGAALILLSFVSYGLQPIVKDWKEGRKKADV
jgi:hypothetical protein